MPEFAEYTTDQQTERKYQDDYALAWQADALCAQTDAEAFFVEKGGSNKSAKKICSECAVKAQCLEYALENDQRHGIWGGTSDRQRRALGYKAVSATS